MSSQNLNETNVPQHPALLHLPHIRVQNANAISSPMTWGFPAMTAFLGLMTGLERRLGRESGMAFRAVGVVCHDFEAHVTTGGYTRAFHLTRNPVLADGSTAGIVEEGRVHLELSLIFDVVLRSDKLGETERQTLAELVSQTLAGMRLAGGSVMPTMSKSRARHAKPSLVLEAEDETDKINQFRKLMRRCLPGFALVSRDDLLQQRLATLQERSPETTVLDAWLDLSRWNHRAVPTADEAEGEPCTWQTDVRAGWTVPIPVGYAALSALQPAGGVANSRDAHTPFRFVETLWSMGQWISPHRLKNLDDLLWYAATDGDANEPDAYRCCNDYRPEISAEPATV